MPKADNEFEFYARISVGPTNHNPLIVIDWARRQTDHVGGPSGIRAKKGQDKKKFLAQRHLDICYPTRALREKYIELVQENCDPAVIIERRKRRKRPFKSGGRRR
jgi:hypothetical protein